MSLYMLQQATYAPLPFLRSRSIDSPYTPLWLDFLRQSRAPPPSPVPEPSTSSSSAPIPSITLPPSPPGTPPDTDVNAWHNDIMFIPNVTFYPSSVLGVGSPYSLHAPTRQGKVAELRIELNSGGKKDKNHSAKKIALKKIVANMTMSNNDMIALFPDIIACMDIPSLEIKKM